MRVPPVPGASVLLLLALSGPLPAHATRAPEAADHVAAAPESELRAIGAALRSARARPDAPTGPLVKAILDAGPQATEAAVVVLVDAMVPRAQPDDDPQTLSAPQRAILLDALTRMPSAEIRALVGERLRSAPAADARVGLAAVHVLGAIGNRHDLAPMARLAPRKNGERAALTRAGREALRLAAGSVLARDAGAWRSIAAVIRSADRGAAQALLEAVGENPDPRGLPILHESARAHPDLAALCVGVASRVGPSHDAEATAEFVAWMCAELEGARPESRRGLLRAIGSLDDGAHAAQLIAALDDDDDGASASAAWALRTLTGFGFGPTPAAWSAWLASETAWNEAERPRRREELASEDPAVVAKAVREYRGRRVGREELGAEIATVLAREDPALRILCCDVLGDLRARTALPELLELFDESDDLVVEAAWKSACAIHGRPLSRHATRAAEQLGLR